MYITVSKFIGLFVLASFVWITPLKANYNAAQNYYKKRDYVAAASAFFNAYQTGNLATKRKAEWGLAESLSKLEFYYSASRFYSTIARRGRKGSNPFYSKALTKLGDINSKIPLGQAHVVKLFKSGKNVSGVSRDAAAFYNYYAGLDSFNKNKRKSAYSFLKKVPVSSPYYNRARFYMGVLASIVNRKSTAINFFEDVRSNSDSGLKGEFVRELADLNIARVKYESGDYEESLASYAQISRNSENWLQSLFEASWAFFMLQKHNNVLGTIHTIQSPFFEDRFYPETYIIQAITFLKLCKIDRVKRSITDFKTRYTPVTRGLKKMLNSTGGSSTSLYKIVRSYSNGTLNKYKEVWPILDSMSRTDYFKEASDTVRFSDREIARLKSMRSWSSTGLRDDLLNFLRKKKRVAVTSAGKRLFSVGKDSYKYLQELQRQTVRINAELLLKNLDKIRSKLNIPVKRKKGDFIGGLQQLKLGQTLEYWPFEGEYWEDELGWYVYNVESECGNTRTLKRTRK